MAEHDARFEEYALAHVLGGLPKSEAAVFRQHLVDCRDCRLRVAELRDIAADLASAEREERRLTSVATRVAQAQDDEAAADGRGWFTPAPRWAQAVAIAVLVAVLGVLFWNYHLRRVTATYADALARQSVVLDVLAAGETLEVDGARGVGGLAAMDDGTLALDLIGLPEVSSRVLVGWLVDGDGDVVDRMPLFPSEQGNLPVATEVGSASVFLVTLEETPPTQTPEGPELARIEIPPSN